MQGLILAAGMGKRLGELTKNCTKCMVKVNGITLIERALRQLEKLELNRIVIVVGYEGKKLMDYIDALKIKTPICYVENPIYSKTNNIYSLGLAKQHLLEDDTLLLESDLIFEDGIFEMLIKDSRESLVLVDKYEPWMDGTCVKINSNDAIEAFVPGSKFVFEDISDYYKTVNVYKFSRNFSETHYVPFLEAYMKALGNNEYYEQVLRVIAMLDEPEIKAKKLEGQLWYEIDDIQDLDIAASMFLDDEDEKVVKLQERYGGYWRYPRMLDFCYLVNPYFPPQKLMDEIKSVFETLLTQYPSGMKVNSLLAARNFGVRQEHIVVGNGATELIKCLMERMVGRIGFIKPTFEEYPNRYSKNDSIVFIPSNEDFSYTADDLINYFSDKDISGLILINPDNPSGNFIEKKDLLRLMDWSKKNGIIIVVDESFVDFADIPDSSVICEDIIQRYRNLVIVKSISKSYGVPGIRLGILVSSDEKIIADMKKEVAIWNINSYGEFYLQISEKYKRDYSSALSKFKLARKKFEEELLTIKELRIIPSQANYVMAEVLNGMTSKELTKQLLIHYDILIKDLSSKITDGRQYIRLAIRNEEDNSKLIQSLREIFDNSARGGIGGRENVNYYSCLQ